MESTAILQAAEVLAQSRIAGTTLAELAVEIRPASEGAAYAIQRAVHQQLRDAGCGSIAGYKIGCTTAVMQRFLNIPNPCAGGVLASTVLPETAVAAFDTYRHVGVECELAVRLGHGLAGADVSREEAADAVQHAMAAIEIVDDRWHDYSAVSTPTLIADDFFAAGCVLGPPSESFDPLTLASAQGAMQINGETVGTGRGSDILGDPLQALVWLAHCLHSHGEQLVAGQIVLLGSLVQTVWVPPGARVEAAVEGLGGASLTFV